MSAVRRSAASSRSSARAWLGARFAHRLERGARRLVGLGERGLGGGAAVGGFAPRGFGLLDFRDQRAALLGEGRRRAFERGRARSARRSARCSERGDLAGRAALRVRPIRRASAAIAARRFARNSASRASACASPRASASTARLAATSPRDSASWFSSSAAEPKRLDRLRGVALGGERLVAARREPHFCFGERGEPRGQPVRLALGRGMRVARRVGLRLRLAPRIARFALGRDRRGELGFGGFDGAALAFGIAGARGQAPRRDRRGGSSPRAGAPPRSAHSRRRRSRPSATGRLREKRAAGRACNCADQRRAERAVDHADLREPARELGRRRDMARERLGAFRQRGIGGVGRGAGPADRRGRIDRRFEIVAERRAERGLEALLDREQVDRRRPQLLRLDVDQLGERLRLRLEPADAPLGLGERSARDVEPLPRRRMRRLGAQRRGFRRRRRRSARLRPRPRAPRHPARRSPACPGLQARSRPRRSGLRAASAAPNGRPIARSSWLRRATRSASAPVSSPNVFSTSASAASAARHARRDLGLAFRHAGRVLRQAGFFGGEPLQRRFGVGAAAAARARYPARTAPGGGRARRCAR